MIVKRISRIKGTSSAARLVRYMIAAQGSIEPESWKRTADYILDTKKTTTQGEKVASYRVTNCGTEDPAQATTIIEAIQAANTRSKADKTYHMVFSFRPGEHPPEEVLHAIEDELCESIGYADHQRISSVHVDTDHLHVHVAINKVHPIGLQNVEPFYDKQRLMEACERLEIKHGLTRTDHGLTGERAYDRANRIRLNPPRQHDSRFRQFLRESYNRALAEGPEAQTYDDLRSLPGGGVAHRPEGYSMLLPGNARHRLDEGGTEQPDGLRRPGNGARRDGGLGGGKAADMEAHAGIESLAGYVAREVAPAIRRAATWQEVHAVTREHGLQIKLRGAGLVIGDRGLPLWCKASSAGRDLSIKALTDRLGPFEPDASRPKPAQRRYAPRPRQGHPSTAGLFAEYQRQRQNAIAARKSGLAVLRKEHAEQAARIKTWSATQRGILKISGKGPIRKAMRANSTAQATAARRALAEQIKGRRKALYADTTLPNWNAWLVQRAEAGNADALDVLRARVEREQQMRGDLLTAERAERAKTAIMESLKPTARKDGTMSYRTADGGLVLDRTSHVRVAKATAGAAFVALTLSVERFDGQALDVRGTDQFRRDVAQLAGVHRVNVTFVDPEMEALRRASMPEQTTARPQAGGQRNKPADHPAAPAAAPSGAEKAGQEPEASAAVHRWIEQRNIDRSKISSIDYNRLWKPQDAGRATYEGRRKMEDGSEVLLLKRGDEMLVKPSGPRVVAKAARWKIGTSVTVDSRGRFVTKSKGQEL